jgi:hypothetical protein
VSTRTALAFKGWRAGQVVPQLKTSYKDGTTGEMVLEKDIEILAHRVGWDRGEQ